MISFQFYSLRKRKEDKEKVAYEHSGIPFNYQKRTKSFLLQQNEYNWTLSFPVKYAHPQSWRSCLLWFVVANVHSTEIHMTEIDTLVLIIVSRLCFCDPSTFNLRNWHYNGGLTLRLQRQIKNMLSQKLIERNERR